MLEFPFYKQDDETSCGCYCMKMILKYYGIDEDIVMIKQRTALDQAGVTMRGLVEGFRSYEIEAKAYRASLEEIKERISLPCILHTIQEGIGHYVVLYAISDEICKVADPAKGRLSYTMAELEAIYSKHVVAIIHPGRYFGYHEKRFQDFLIQIFTRHRTSFFALTALSILLSLLHYILAAVFAYMIDLMNPDTPLLWLGYVAAFFLLVSVLQVRLTSLSERQVIRLTHLLNQKYILPVFKQMLDCDESFFDQGSGKLMAKIDQFYEMIRYIVSFLKGLLGDGLMVILIIAGLWLISWPMSVMAFFFLGVMSLYVYLFSPGLLKIYEQALISHQKHQLALWEFLTERAIGLRYMRRRAFLKRYRDAFIDHEGILYEQETCMLRLHIHLQYLAAISTVSVLLIGLMLYHAKLITMGRLFMFYILLNEIYAPVISLCQLLISYRQCALIFERYKSFQPPVSDSQGILTDQIKCITINNVTAGYGYHPPVFSHLDLLFTHSTLIFGANGTGKSTLFHLLLKQRVRYKGEVLLNSSPLCDLSAESIREHIGYLREEEVFFHDTLYHNLHCQDLSRIEAVFQLLGCEELLLHLDDVLTQEGAPLSKGQCQLAALARLLLQPYDVYLLDEALSHVAFDQVQHIIRRLFEDPDHIFLIVTHHTNLMRTSCRLWKRRLQSL
ncbi:MAG: cysteine peptidase family C39 domain-containing protein [bacterium]